MAIDIDLLIRTCLEAGATDVLLTPGTRIGKIQVRSGSTTLTSQMVPLEGLTVLARKVGALAGLDLEQRKPGEPFEVRIGSFDMASAVIRVTALMSAAGPVLRLRLQPMGLLQEANHDFRHGAFGGRAVLKWLDRSHGYIAIVGPASSGKTSALHHLLYSLAGKPCELISEAGEFKLPAGSIRVPAARDGSGVLAVDEMDELGKMQLAVAAARRRLVVSTLTAPNLGAAVQRLRNALLGFEDPPEVLGFLRVGWDELPAEQPGKNPVRRRPVYTWFAVGDAEGRCPSCGQPAERSRCTGCDSRIVSPDLLTRVEDFAAFQAVEHLE